MWRGTESWQICIYYNGHRSLLEPNEAHGNTFPDGYEAVSCFFSYDLNNVMVSQNADREFVSFLWTPAVHITIREQILFQIMMIRLADDEAVKQQLFLFDLYIIFFVSFRWVSWCFVQMQLCEKVKQYAKWKMLLIQCQPDGANYINRQYVLWYHLKVNCIALFVCSIYCYIDI